jgi:hypothetical protein
MAPLAILLLTTFASAGQFCWHSRQSPKKAEPALSLERPKCGGEANNRLRFERRSDGGTATDFNDSWGWFSNTQEACRKAQKGLDFWLDAYSSKIRELNATGDVELPTTIVMRKTVMLGPRYFAFEGSCSSFSERVQKSIDCEPACKSGAAQCMGFSCKDLASDELGLKELDKDKLIKDFITIGEAIERTAKKK